MVLAASWLKIHADSLPEPKVASFELQEEWRTKASAELRMIPPLALKWVRSHLDGFGVSCGTVVQDLTIVTQWVQETIASSVPQGERRISLALRTSLISRSINENGSKITMTWLTGALRGLGYVCQGR